MSQPTEDLLHAYLEHVAALRDADEPLQPEQLRQIALEMGLSEGDIAAAARAGAAHFERGRNFVAHQRWDDAVGELTRAAALLPQRLDVLETLAQAHFGRWKAGGGADDRQAAERLARRCLTIDPGHKASYELLNALDRRGSPRRRTAQAVGIVVILVGIAAYAHLNRPIPRATTQPWAFPSTEGASTAAPTPHVEDRARDLPLRLAQTPQAGGLTLDPRRVRLNNYDDVSYLSLGAILHNAGARQLEAVRTRVEILDGQGKVLRSDSIEPLASHHAPLLPGDGHYFSHTLKTDARAREVRLTVQTLDAVPYRGTPPKTRPVPLEWGTEQPSHLHVALGERHAAERPMFGDKDVYVEPTFVLRNTGQAAIKTLKMELEWRDRDERVLKAANQLLVYGEGAALLPGEARPVNWIGIVPGSYHHYRVRVLEIE